MKVKKILIVSHYFPPHLGGIEIVAQNQARRLAELGHHVTVVTSSVSDAEVSETKDRVRVVRIKAWNILEKKGIAFPLFSPRIVLTLVKEAKKTDVVHIHDAFYLSSFWAAVAARMYKRPIILTQHVALVPHPSKITMLIQQIVYKTTGGYIFKSSTKVMTLNDRVTDFLISRGVPKDKIVWLPNGVDGKLFHPATDYEQQAMRKKYNLSVDSVVVLFVGRFVPKKGFDKLLDAESNEYQLAFVGGLTSQKSSKKLKFLGQVSQTELAEIYRSADIFVLPSEGEGFPLSVQEAMSSGLPIVMADDRGYAQYKLNGDLVKLLQSTEPAVIKEALTSLAQNRQQRDRMREYSLRYTKDHFLWELVIKKLDAMYDGVLSEQGKI